LLSRYSLDPIAVEAAFHRHAGQLHAACKPGQGSIALGGKTLRGSFDTFHDRAAAQILSAFATDTALVLAHVDIAEKSNEIPAAQALLAELGVDPAIIVTLDALHCQKIVRMRSQGQSRADRLGQRQPAHPAPARPPYRRRRQAPHCGPKPHPGPQPRRAPHRQRLRPGNDLAGTLWQSYVAAIIRVEREVFTRSAATGLLRRTTDKAF
jgi:predicted transposase YbfD/YdcC